MSTWNWQQPGDRIWKVISDYKKGIISVFDENGKLILKQIGLTEEAIKMIEKNFLSVVAPSGDNVLRRPNNDPMYV